MALSHSNIVAAKVNTFSFNIQQVISKETTGNVVFSPFSIYTTLAMLCIGAGGKTKKEISSALSWKDGDLTPLLEMLKPLYSSLIQNKSTLNIANKAWVGQNTKILESYQDNVMKYFDVEIGNADFSNPELAREKINKWVAEKTGDKIKNLFPHGSISDTTALVLANALYFKGEWEKKFDKLDTRDYDFYLSKEESVKAKFMYMHDKFTVANDYEHKLHLLELPYAGDAFSMIFVLPFAKSDDLGKITDFDDLDKVYQSIKDKTETFQKWIVELSSNEKFQEEVDIYVPKFKIKLTLDLLNQLRMLGIKEVFEPGAADLQSIGGPMSDLFVSSAVHESYILLTRKVPQLLLQQDLV